jgi:hypothetical protein
MELQAGASLKDAPVAADGFTATAERGFDIRATLPRFARPRKAPAVAGGPGHAVGNPDTFTDYSIGNRRPLAIGGLRFVVGHLPKRFSRTTKKGVRKQTPSPKKS